MSHARNLLLLLSLCAPLVACSPIADRCRAETLLVAVTLDDSSAAADSFHVTLAIDGAPSVDLTVAHSGGAAGNLVIAFPHGYPRGHTIGIHVDALAGGVVVGSGDASQPLAADCEVTPLAIRAVVTDDLGTGDLATAAVADLAPPADLAQLVPADMVCIATAETGANCFDGIDNDCDGHTDCDDSDCTATSQCVPAPTAAFTLGISVLQSSLCPGMFTSEVVINEGLGPVGVDCPTTGCGCAATNNCNANVDSYNAAVGGSCINEAVSNTASSAMCRPFSGNNPTKGLISGPIVNAGASCNANGSSTRSATQWATSDRFCKTTSQSTGGCSAGQVCVPKLAGQQTCEVAAGAVACDSGYTASGGPWYTGLTDGRSCTCSCGAASGGSCGTTIALYTASGCAGGAAATMSASQSQCSLSATSFASLQITGSAPPSCGGATTTLGGSGLVGTGQQTLCCRP